VNIDAAAGRCVFNTDVLRFECKSHVYFYSATRVEQDGGPAVAVFTLGAFRIGAGVVVDAVGSRPLVIDARGPVSIAGELRASGAQTALDGTPVPPSGSTGGSGVGTHGSAFCGGAPDIGAKRYGSASMSPLFGGSGKALAYGGGAVQITSSAEIVVKPGGLIDVNGMGGVGLPGMDHGTDYTGGGSGGAILLEAPSVTVAGALAANGGGWVGTGGTSPDVTQALGCDGGHDGAGSVGDDPNGVAGGTGQGFSFFCLGGGGAGWIAVRSAACSLPGTMSPSLNSGCANILPLATH
jgi:hypothetical protein